MHKSLHTLCVRQVVLIIKGLRLGPSSATLDSSLDCFTSQSSHLMSGDNSRGH